MKLGDLCGSETERLTAADALMIDYIDISSVSNESKSIIGKQTLQSREAPSRAQRVIKADDILVSTVRPNLNAVAVYDGSFENLAVASTGFCVLRCKPGVSHRFVFNICKSNAFIKAMTEQATGASYPAVNDRIIRAFEVPDLDYESQTRLAGRLDSIQLIIDLRKQQLRELDDLIKARFVEMFGSIRETVPLSYYIDSLVAGKSLAGEEECTNKVLKTGAATHDYFDASQVKNLPKEYVPLPEHLIHDGDVIISRMNTAELVGAAAYIWAAPNNTYLPDRLWRAELTDKANPIFVWQSIIQPTTKEAIRRIAGGTSGSMKNISKPGLLGLHVKKVEMSTQNKFAAFVSQVDKSKVVVQEALDKAQLLFDSLMQQYFG